MMLQNRFYSFRSLAVIVIKLLTLLAVIALKLLMLFIRRKSKFELVISKHCKLYMGVFLFVDRHQNLVRPRLLVCNCITIAVCNIFKCLHFPDCRAESSFLTRTGKMANDIASIMSLLGVERRSQTNMPHGRHTETALRKT